MSSVLIWLLLSYWLQKAVPKLKCHSWFQPIKLAKCYQSSSLTQTGSLSSVPAAASRCKILPIIRPDVQKVPPPGFHTTKSCVLLWCWWMTTDDENKKTDFTQQKFDERPFWNVLLWSFYLRVGIRFKFDSTLTCYVRDGDTNELKKKVVHRKKHSKEKTNTAAWWCMKCSQIYSILSRWAC